MLLHSYDYTEVGLWYFPRSYTNDTMRFLFIALGFPPGDSGLYTCTQKTKNNNIHKEKQYIPQNTQNRKQHIRNKN